MLQQITERHSARRTPRLCMVLTRFKDCLKHGAIIWSRSSTHCFVTISLMSLLCKSLNVHPSMAFFQSAVVPHHVHACTKHAAILDLSDCLLTASASVHHYGQLRCASLLSACCLAMSYFSPCCICWSAQIPSAYSLCKCPARTPQDSSRHFHCSCCMSQHQSLCVEPMDFPEKFLKRLSALSCWLFLACRGTSA